MNKHAQPHDEAAKRALRKGAQAALLAGMLVLFAVSGATLVGGCGSGGIEGWDWKSTDGEGPQDILPPTTPKRLRAARLEEVGIRLTWEDSTDDMGVRGYSVYRDGAWVMNTPIARADDADAQHGRSYRYRVRAFDFTGKQSGVSEAVEVDPWWISAPALPDARHLAGAIGLAIDDHGRLHLAYHDSAFDAVRYATNASGRWQTETISVPQHTIHYADCGIVVTDGGRVHVAYVDLQAGQVVHAERQTHDVWNLTPVLAHPEVYSHCSLAADAMGRLAIGYVVEGDPYCAVETDGGWVLEEIEVPEEVGVPYGRKTALAVEVTYDTAGALHVSVSSSWWGYAYARRGEGTWHFEVIARWQPTIMGTLKIALDAEGVPYVAWDTGSLSGRAYGSGALAERRDGAWPVDRTSGVRLPRALACAGPGTVHLVGHAKGVAHAVRTAGVWMEALLDTAEGGDMAMVLDAEGRVHVAYSRDGAIRYATNR